MAEGVAVRLGVTLGVAESVRVTDGVLLGVGAPDAVGLGVRVSEAVWESVATCDVDCVGVPVRVISDVMVCDHEAVTVSVCELD